jgi:Fe-S-cluster-containing dehydrogenase component
MVEISSGGKTLAMAAFPLPGHADRSVSVALGYGRGEAAGRIGAGSGFNTYTLRTSEAMHVAGATVTKAAGTYVLASTQDHGASNPVADKGIQDRLPTLVREGTLAEYIARPKFAKAPPGYHVAHRLSLWDEDKAFHEATDYAGTNHAWAMTIDLSTCTGCSACVTACQSENNIPVVGKDQVSRGREMHWIRIDRYFGFAATRHDDHGVPEEFDMSTLDRVAIQPVTCQHCENAPCEQVCPVAATVHDDDGLNVMVYNRCIGTRYCSNNCPYKVRRFNYFDFHRRDPIRDSDYWLHVKPEYYVKDGADPRKQMAFNPDVTVRMRGVMEKCTFCVQRIAKAKIEHKNEWAKKGGSALGAEGPIEDGTIVPACGQACPTQAIVFGDLKDPQSRVAKLTKHERSYEMLEELNTKPRLKYLARLRNPAIADATSTHGGHDGHESHDGHDHGKESHG